MIGLDSLGPLKPEALNTGSQAVENLRNSGDINSNRIVPTGNSLIGFEEDNRNNSAKTQEMQFTGEGINDQLFLFKCGVVVEEQSGTIRNKH